MPLTLAVLLAGNHLELGRRIGIPAIPRMPQAKRRRLERRIGRR